mgnify:CR=1 FL=1
MRLLEDSQLYKGIFWIPNIENPEDLVDEDK